MAFETASDGRVKRRGGEGGRRSKMNIVNEKKN
jgi:hypothetical protein